MPIEVAEVPSWTCSLGVVEGVRVVLVLVGAIVTSSTGVEIGDLGHDCQS